MQVFRRRSAVLSPLFCLMLAAMLLLLPLRWLLAAALAAAVHEGGHLLVLHLCGARVTGLRFHAGGIVIESEPLAASRELLCALAGPCAGLTLLLFSRLLPRTAICAGFQSAYNLLPVYPLDGGRALRALTRLTLPPHTAARVCRVLEVLTLLLLAFFGLYGALRLHLGLPPLVLAALLLAKIPCKPHAERLQ